MRKILITLTAAVLTFALSGCNDLDKLAEIEELTSMMERMGIEQQKDSLDADPGTRGRTESLGACTALSFQRRENLRAE